MSPVLRRSQPAVSSLALVVALLAMVTAAAGAGFAAATIGTAQLENNAVTAAKIKKNAVTTKKIKKNAVTGAKIRNGSVTVADLPANERQRSVQLLGGGEGDCLWQSGSVEVPGIGAPTFRKDRFGTVHLAGLAISADGPGGDATCDPNDPGQSADAVAFVLPAGYIPAKTLLVGGAAGFTLVVGPQGYVDGPLTLPPGAVASLFGGSGAVLLDSVSYEPVGSDVVIPKMAASGRFAPDQFGRFSQD